MSSGNLIRMFASVTMTLFTIMVVLGAIGVVLDQFILSSLSMTGIDMKFASQVLPMFHWFNDIPYIIVPVLFLEVIVVTISLATYQREVYY